MKVKMFLVVSAALYTHAVNAITRYVTPTGAGLQNGLSWANAFAGTSLQLAINASAPGDEVWVVSGTYFTTSTASRTVYFSLVNGVAVYGSFIGTETTLSQRNFTCGFTSVLSAEINLPGNADNSYHVISNTSLNSTAILDGFTITGGNSNFDVAGNDSRSHGGGMLNLAANGGTCSPTVQNCMFINNTAVFGGGMFNNGFNTGNANPAITNCVFLQNTATQGGGGIDNFGYSGNASPVITNSIFYGNNAAARAGAMYCWGGGNGNANPTVLNSVFVNNTSFDGGGFVCDRTNTGSGNSGTATPVVRNSIFWGNTASGTGPQFYTLGGGGFAATYTAIDISNQNPPHSITGPGTGNIFTAPLFVNIADADGADNCWLTNDDGLQLQLASVGIDAGDNTGVPSTDIRNLNRIVNAVVDVGAYEFNAAVLPVALVEFYGKEIQGNSLLQWKTATEQNSRLFEIERSSDGVRFNKVGEVVASGNSTQPKQYQFIDDSLSAAKNYYRLKQIDNNGNYIISHTILLTTKNDFSPVTIYPNPVKNTFSITVTDLQFLNREFFILNSSGQVIETLRLTNNTTVINFTGKPVGIYLLLNKQLGVLQKIYKLQ